MKGFIYLLLSGASAAFWTWVAGIFFHRMPLWGKGLLFLLLFLPAFCILCCFAVSGDRYDEEENHLAVREEDV